MAKWEQLIAARERKHLSQMEAAELLNVGLATYQRWELGKRKPQPHHKRQIYEKFELLTEEKIIFLPEVEPFPISEVSISVMSISPTEISVSAFNEEIHKLRSHLTVNMTSHLLSLALMDHLTYNEKRAVIQQTIKEFDSMNTDNKNYQISRREALWSLATLPIMTLGLTTPGKSIPTSQYASAIAHCTASLESCWELYRSSDPGATTLAFDCVTKYLSILQEIMKNSPTHRAEALNLATRYALVKTLLGWICVGPTEMVQYAKEAVVLSRETGDISLQLSAYSKLTWSYFYLKKDGFALDTAQEAEALLMHYALSPNAQPLHSCVQGCTYSALALMQAKNGQSPDIALGKALNTDLAESYAFMDFKRSTLLLNAGWTYCYSGNQAKAIAMLEQRVDPETLKPRLAQSSTMGQVETINVMALSSLRARNRDMEKTIHLWVAGIEGAKTLKHEQCFSEALTNYELMDAIWPDEPRIANLRDHIVHWKE
jgi:transcriptional regulator with XRE-family HTH domain